LPFTPTAEREFTRTDKLIAFMRLYQSGQRPIESVRLNVSIRNAANQLKWNENQTVGVDRFFGIERTDATATPTPQPLRGVTTAPVLRGSPTPVPSPSDQFANLALRTADLRFDLPTKNLDPGAYLLTFEGTLSGTTIRRDVRFDIR
jgi:hypothetical protein